MTLIAGNVPAVDKPGQVVGPILYGGGGLSVDSMVSFSSQQVRANVSAVMQVAAARRHLDQEEIQGEADGSGGSVNRSEPWAKYPFLRLSPRVCSLIAVASH